MAVLMRMPSGNARLWLLVARRPHSNEVTFSIDCFCFFGNEIVLIPTAITFATTPTRMNVIRAT